MRTESFQPALLDLSRLVRSLYILRGDEFAFVGTRQDLPGSGADL